MSEFVTVAKTEDIPPGEGRAFEVNESMVAVFNNDGEYLAIDDMCPHMGASLASGHFDRDDCTVTCPWHAWSFDTRDGSWCDNRRLKIDVYQVRVVGDDIQVALVEPASDESEPSDENPVSEDNASDSTDLDGPGTAEKPDTHSPLGHPDESQLENE